MNTEEIISKMTLEDKIKFCTGKNFWETAEFEKYGIPGLFMCDGPHGLRKQEDAENMGDINDSCPATCFPTAVTTASSLDTELAERVGAAIGEEAAAHGVGLLLGPGANLKRNPLCGRNFEYFSEDPYLSGKIAAGFIRGTESKGVGATLKHFAANSQELLRFTSDGIMDMRTLRELYLTAFEIAVKEGKPSAVMCAYPKLNGTYCSDNRELLTDILRDEWGFEGMVVTDWGALNDRTKALKAGCDLTMPGCGNYMEKAVINAVKDGSLPEECIDKSVRRILELVLRENEALKQPRSCDYEAHHALAREAALKGAVLLKNEDKLLPLKEQSKIALIGAMAREMRYQGAGSSHINPVKLSQPIDYFPDCIYAQGCDDSGDTTEALIAEAVEAAKKAEAAVIFAGLPASFESEGFDRSDMRMPEGHIRMINAVSEANANTVVVLLCGSPVECPWADKVKAILYMGLPGQAGGEAAAELLYGRANPCGRLSESWPLKYEDVPSSEIYGKGRDALYEEGIYVGYRYYDKAGIPLRWPFGYGLSYTDFEYSDIKADGNSISVTVKNIGPMQGEEAVCLYIMPPEGGIHRPNRELKGFKKISLQPGESKTVSFTLCDRSFAIWNDGWVIPGGIYTCVIGGLSVLFPREGACIPAPEWQKGSFYEGASTKPRQSEWEAMLGRAYSVSKPQKGFFTRENTISEMKKESTVMKIVSFFILCALTKGRPRKAKSDEPELRMMLAMTMESPLKTMQMFGGLGDNIVQGLLKMANGHFFKGIF
ncbi:MAG: glycoside hydrolase family 3 C-terminal domain-containing protein, partial [Oscillospiraceae bacterium]|nr:glycoside hydrolase family 3 C-terminal domain-containing protein [Oscillospiraceae bacterium]